MARRKLGLQRHCVARRQHFQFARVGARATAAQPLGLHQRQFGVLEQIERIARVAPERHADAGRRKDVAAVQRVRRAAGLDQFVADGSGFAAAMRRR